MFDNPSWVKLGAQKKPTHHLARDKKTGGYNNPPSYSPQLTIHFTHFLVLSFTLLSDIFFCRFSLSLVSSHYSSSDLSYLLSYISIWFVLFHLLWFLFLRFPLLSSSSTFIFSFRCTFFWSFCFGFGSVFSCFIVHCMLDLL